MKRMRRFLSVMLTAAMLATSLPQPGYSTEAVPLQTQETADLSSAQAAAEEESAQEKTGDQSQEESAQSAASDQAGDTSSAPAESAGGESSSAAPAGKDSSSAAPADVSDGAAAGQTDSASTAGGETASASDGKASSGKDASEAGSAGSSEAGGTEAGESGTGKTGEAQNAASPDAASESVNPDASADADNQPAGEVTGTEDGSGEDAQAKPGDLLGEEEDEDLVGAAVTDVVTTTLELTWKWNDGSNKKGKRPAAPKANDILKWAGLTYSKDSGEKKPYSANSPIEEGLDNSAFGGDSKPVLTPSVSESSDGNTLTYSITVPTSYSVGGENHELAWNWAWNTGKQAKKVDGYMLWPEGKATGSGSTGTGSGSSADGLTEVTYTLILDYKAAVEWRDNNNAYKTRPDMNSLLNTFTLKRYGDNQSAGDAASVDGSSSLLTAEPGDSVSKKPENMTGDAWAAQQAKWAKTRYTISVKDESPLPAYSEKGWEYHYFISMSAGDQGTPRIPVKDGNATSGNGVDYYRQSGFVNTGDYRSDSSRLFDGGVMSMTLDGDTQVSYTNVWKDLGSTAERPDYTLYLYRMDDPEDPDTTWSKAMEEGAIVERTTLTDAINNAHPVPGFDSMAIPTEKTAGTTDQKAGTQTIQVLFHNEEDENDTWLRKYNGNGQKYVYFALLLGGGNDYSTTIDNSKTGYVQALKDFFARYGAVYVLNGGTITEQRKGTCDLDASKLFYATAMQNMKVDVTFSLQKMIEGESEWKYADWDTDIDADHLDPKVAEYVKKSEGDGHVLLTIGNFSSEVSEQHVTGPVTQKYTPDGRQLSYRWVESRITVYPSGSAEPIIGNVEIEKQEGEDGYPVYRPVEMKNAGPGVGGQHTTAYFQPKQTSNNSVSNVLQGKVKVRIRKTWYMSGKGDVTADKDVVGGLKANISIKRDGASTDQDSVALTFKNLKSVHDLKSNQDMSMWVSEDKEYDRYDSSSGAEIDIDAEEASVLSKDGTPDSRWHYIKKETLGVEDGELVRTITFTNTTANGLRSMTFNVRGQYLDQTDLLTRKPIQVGVFRKDTGELVKDTDGNPAVLVLDEGNLYYASIDVTQRSADDTVDNYIVKEISLEGDEAAPVSYYAAGTSAADGQYAGSDADQAKAVASRQDPEEGVYSDPSKIAGVITPDTAKPAGLDYSYQVFVTKTSRPDSFKANYTIANRRTATLTVDLTKTWNAGGAYPSATFELYRVKGTKTAEEKVAEFTLPLEDGEETPEDLAAKGITITSEKAEDGSTAWSVHAANQAKYDDLGWQYHYYVKETKVDGIDVVDGGVRATDGAVYSSSVSQKSYTLGGRANLHSGDVYTWSAANVRTGSLDLYINEVWRDDGTDPVIKNRPDVAFHIKRISVDNETYDSFTEGGSFSSEAVKAYCKEHQTDKNVTEVTGYKLWQTTLNDWLWQCHVVGDFPKYDEAGNRYLYFMTETVGAGYKRKYDNGPAYEGGKERVNKTEKGVSSTVDVLPISDHEVSGETGDNVLMLYDHDPAKDTDHNAYSRTVINYRKGSRTLTAKKLWKLPAAWTISAKLLPTLKLTLYRSIQNLAETGTSGQTGSGYTKKDLEGWIAHKADTGIEEVKVYNSTKTDKDGKTTQILAGDYEEGDDPFNPNGKKKTEIVLNDNPDIELTVDSFMKQVDNLPTYDEYGRIYHYYLLEKVLRKGSSDGTGSGSGDSTAEMPQDIENYPADSIRIDSGTSLIENIYKAAGKFVQFNVSKTWVSERSDVDAKDLAPVTFDLYVRFPDGKGKTTLIPVATKTLKPSSEVSRTGDSDSTDGKTRVRTCTFDNVTAGSKTSAGEAIKNPFTATQLYPEEFAAGDDGTTDTAESRLPYYGPDGKPLTYVIRETGAPHGYIVSAKYDLYNTTNTADDTEFADTEFTEVKDKAGAYQADIPTATQTVDNGEHKNTYLESLSFTNTYTGMRAPLSVEKKWAGDQGYSDAYRPAAVRLYIGRRWDSATWADGTTMDGDDETNAKVTVKDGNGATTDLTQGIVLTSSTENSKNWKWSTPEVTELSEGATAQQIQAEQAKQVPVYAPNGQPYQYYVSSEKCYSTVGAAQNDPVKTPSSDTNAGEETGAGSGTGTGDQAQSTAEDKYLKFYQGTTTEVATLTGEPGTVGTVEYTNTFRTQDFSASKQWTNGATDTQLSGQELGKLISYGYLPNQMTLKLVRKIDGDRTWTGAEVTDTGDTKKNIHIKTTQGEDAEDVTVTITSDHYTDATLHTWTHLPLYDMEGSKYTYSATETIGDFTYTARDNEKTDKIADPFRGETASTVADATEQQAVKIDNKLDLTPVRLKKFWDDNSNRDNTRVRLTFNVSRKNAQRSADTNTTVPESVTDNKGGTIANTPDNCWYKTIYLPTPAEGQTIDGLFTVSEVPAEKADQFNNNYTMENGGLAAFTAADTDAATGDSTPATFTATNTLKEKDTRRDTITYTATKKFEGDLDWASVIRPVIKIQLQYQNRNKTQWVDVDANNYTTVFDTVPDLEEGQNPGQKTIILNQAETGTPAGWTCLSDANSGSVTWTGLYKYWPRETEDEYGTPDKIQYRVREIVGTAENQGASYNQGVPSVDPADENNIRATITNTYSGEPVYVKKTWQNGKAGSTYANTNLKVVEHWVDCGVIPATLTYKLQYKQQGSADSDWKDVTSKNADGQPSAVTHTFNMKTVAAGSVEWPDLKVPEYDKDGRRISYRLIEESGKVSINGTEYPISYGESGSPRAGDTANIDSKTVDSISANAPLVRTNALDTNTLTVKKVWTDGDNRDGMRGEVEYTLYRDGRVYGTGKLNDENSWTETWNDLPQCKTENSNQNSQYYVVETKVNGNTVGADGKTDQYTATYSAAADSGITLGSSNNEIAITNTHQMLTMKWMAKKSWAGDDTWKSKTRFDVYAKLQYKVGNGTWADVQHKDASQVDANGYYKESDVSIAYTTSSVIQKIYDKSKLDQTPTVTWEHLPQYADHGKKISYRVVELDGQGKGNVLEENAVSRGYKVTYSSSKVNAQNTTVDCTTITNTLITGSVRVEKTWHDEKNRDNLEGVLTYHLYREEDGKFTEVASQTAAQKAGNEGGSEDVEFTDLPVYADGSDNASQYYLTETFDNSDKYTTTIKVGGAEVSSTHAFTLLDNQSKVYEPQVQVTNTQSNMDPQTFTVRKDWEDSENEFGTRPTEIHVTLKYRVKNAAEGSADATWQPVEQRTLANIEGVQQYDGNGVYSTDAATQTLSSTNNWTFTWNNLRKNTGNGSEVEYKVFETDANGSEIAIDNNLGYKVTYQTDELNAQDQTAGVDTVIRNELLIGSIKAVKTWVDENNRDNLEGNITYKLIRDGATIDTQVVKKNQNWAYQWNRLPVYKNGTTTQEKSVYQITESYDGYSTTVEPATITLDVTNTEAKPFTVTITNTQNEMAKTGYSAHKTWTGDSDNYYRTRFDVFAKLQYQVAGADSKDTWHDVVKAEKTKKQVQIGTDKDGQPIMGYEQYADDGVYTTSSVIQQFTEENSWAVSWEDLRQFTQAGKKVTYRAIETDKDGHELGIGADGKPEAINGYSVSYQPTANKEATAGRTEITNTLITGSLDVIKVWNDEVNRESTRKEVTYDLYRDWNGTEDKDAKLISTVKVGPDSWEILYPESRKTSGKNIIQHWGFKWTGLPVYANQNTDNKTGKSSYTLVERSIDGYTTVNPKAVTLEEATPSPDDISGQAADSGLKIDSDGTAAIMQAGRYVGEREEKDLPETTTPVTPFDSSQDLYSASVTVTN